MFNVKYHDIVRIFIIISPVVPCIYVAAVWADIKECSWITLYHVCMYACVYACMRVCVHACMRVYVYAKKINIRRVRIYVVRFLVYIMTLAFVI